MPQESKLNCARIQHSKISCHPNLNYVSIKSQHFPLLQLCYHYHNKKKLVTTQCIHVLAFKNVITCSRVVCLEVTSDSSLSIFLISLLIWYSCSCSSVCSSWIFSWRNCNDWQWNSIAGQSRLSFPTLRGY